MSLGKRLKGLREKRTQQYIADRVGVSRASYCHYENDHVQPDIETLHRLADIYQVSVDYLVGRARDERAQETERILHELIVKYNIDVTNNDSREKLEQIIALVFAGQH
jgi:transcriptional regulator with XRE-family HTH domain